MLKSTLLLFSIYLLISLSFSPSLDIIIRGPSRGDRGILRQVQKFVSLTSSLLILTFIYPGILYFGLLADTVKGSIFVQGASCIKCSFMLVERFSFYFVCLLVLGTRCAQKGGVTLANQQLTFCLFFGVGSSAVALSTAHLQEPGQSGQGS